MPPKNATLSNSQTIRTLKTKRNQACGRLPEETEADRLFANGNCDAKAKRSKPQGKVVAADAEVTVDGVTMLSPAWNTMDLWIKMEPASLEKVFRAIRDEARLATVESRLDRGADDSRRRTPHATRRG